MGNIIALLVALGNAILFFFLVKFIFFDLDTVKKDDGNFDLFENMEKVTLTSGWKIYSEENSFTMPKK